MHFFVESIQFNTFSRNIQSVRTRTTDSRIAENRKQNITSYCSEK